MKQTILIVDDEAPIRELLQSYFVKQGYGVTTAGNAGETIDRMSDKNIDLVILDFVLPDTDGLELLGILRTQRQDLPVIVMTGFGFDEALLREAKQKGASNYVSKTMPLDQLLKAVQEALSLK